VGLAVTGKGAGGTLEPDAELGLAARVLSRARNVGHGHPEHLRRLCRDLTWGRTGGTSSVASSAGVAVDLA
jgi:hypothetical protein